MVRVVFIGDEISAAGFRLAGVRAETPDRGETAAIFARLRSECDLLLVTAEYAAAVSSDLLSAAAREDVPLMLVVPDVRGRSEAPDMMRSADRALGIES